jgi:N-acetylneuraminic acid mutarotase
MSHNSLIARRILLSLGVLLFAACTPAAPASPPTPPPPTQPPPVATQAPPTATQALPTATQAPLSAKPTQAAGLNPSPRSEISLAYDSKTNQVLFFGGVKVDPCWNDCPPMLGDTWLYDVASNVWMEFKPSTAPEPRDNTAMAYDAESDRIILFGGFIAADNYAPRETWVFDMNTKTWAQMKSQGPANHFGHSMIYDTKADRMIVFGGFNFNDNVATNDIWAYNYNNDTWTEMKPAVSPPGRNFQSMAYDSKADRVIMWGGWGTTNADNDTSLWVFDYNTDNWEERKPTGGPSSRAFHNMTYDPKADRTILYGGYTGGMPETAFDFSTNNESETWAYNYNQNTWTLLNPSENPGKLTSTGQVYLPSIDRTLLFGGRFDFGKFNDKTWLYDYASDTWTKASANAALSPSSPSAIEQVGLSPSPRGLFAMAYNSKSDQVVLYGGETGEYTLQSSYNDETWAYNVASNTWTELKPATSPGPLAMAELAYDAESDRMILYSGGMMPNHWQSDNATWAYDSTTNNWTKMKAIGPTDHHGCQMVYDSESDRIILFGGYNIPDDQLSQSTWAYDYNTDTWTEMQPATNPPGRNLHSMTYDSSVDRIIMWGGDSATMSNPNATKDRSVWAYDYNTNTWEEWKTTQAPVARFAAAIAYDAGANRTILYGGGENGLSDMWAYDYKENTWTQLKPKENPGKIGWHEMVYIPTIDRLFIFGGFSNDNPSGKTWLYDFKTNTWTEVTLKP